MESSSATTDVSVTPSSDSSTVQDSSIFSYISDLSPIKPLKAAPAAQGFPGLSSPPLVFASPQFDSRKPLDLKRSHCAVSLFRQDDDKDGHIPTGPHEFKKSFSQLSTGSNPQTEYVRRSNSSRCGQIHKTIGCSNEYFNDLLADCTDCTDSANSDSNQSNDASRLLDGSAYLKDSVNLSNKDGKQNLAVLVDASPANFEQGKEENQRSSLPSHLKPAEELNAPYFIQGHYEYGNNEGVTFLNTPIVNTTALVSKATQSNLGKRIHTHIEETPPNYIWSSPCSWTPSNFPWFYWSTASTGYSQVLGSSCADIPVTPGYMQLGNMSQSQYNKNLRSTVSKPSGIGLHLNSIVNALPFSSPSRINVADRSCSSVSAQIEGRNADSHASASVSSASCPSSSTTKPPLKLVEHRATSDLYKKTYFEHSDITKEFNQTNPKKKRKKTSETSDDNSCKRCNCKKTKCLKLYCDCFAAGIYCDGPCSCEGCFNRVEYEDTVLEAREQIESRNPMAFAPKIVPRLSQALSIRSGEDGDRSAPLSGRHKKGCNCKKSMCLKKYCECYQANVGCSDVCRCEGCKNMYGRKGEYNISREAVSLGTLNDKSSFSSEQKKELEATTNIYLLPEYGNPQSLTSITPSLQSSEHGNDADASKARLCSARYLSSPESVTTLLLPNGPNLNVPRSPINSATHEVMIHKTRKCILNSSCSEQEPYAGNNEDVSEITPKRRKLGNICHLNSLPTYSTSDPTLSFESPKTEDLVNNSSPQFVFGSGRLSSVSFCPWRDSPVTPDSPFTERNERKLLQVNSDDRLLHILEDETPQILNENSTPSNTVKVNSPKKKRVSPPCNRSSSGSSSFTALTSGRKILRSVPLLTPCLGPNSRLNEKMRGPQNPRNSE